MPPVVVMSESPKLMPGSSLKVKLMVAVWPDRSPLLLLLMASVGASVSMTIAGVAPAPPGFPAASA